MSYFVNNLNQKIAYKFFKGKSPGIVFIHGLNSDMEGTKAISIENFQIELVINPRSCCTLLFDKMTSSIDKSFLIFLNTNEKFFPEVLRVFSAVSENFPLKISKQLKFLYSITFFSIFEYEFSKSLRYKDKDEKLSNIWYGKFWEDRSFIILYNSEWFRRFFLTWNHSSDELRYRYIFSCLQVIFLAIGPFSRLSVIDAQAVRKEKNGWRA